MKKTLITSTIAAVIIGGTLFALNKETPVEEPIKSQAVVKTIEKDTETAPEAVEASEIVETDTLSTMTVETHTEPLNEAVEQVTYSETIPQFVLDKAAEYQNARTSMNERYMSDIWWIYDERPELLQEATYISTLEKMKAAYNSFNIIVNQYQGTQAVKASL